MKVKRIGADKRRAELNKVALENQKKIIKSSIKNFEECFFGFAKYSESEKMYWYEKVNDIEGEVFKTTMTFTDKKTNNIGFLTRTTDLTQYRKYIREKGIEKYEDVDPADVKKWLDEHSEIQKEKES